MDATPPPCHVPGLPAVVPSGAGSRAGWAYTPALGELIAELYAESDAGGLWGIHAALPDRVPPPRVVTAWKSQYPAFGLLMRQAERLRAERLVEEAIVIADTGSGTPARVALQIGARQYLAERLDRARFGKNAGDSSGLSEPGAAQGQLTAADVSDDQLAALALAGATATGAGAGG